MKEKLDYAQSAYKKDPAWAWLIFTLSSFFILPEYISPFILFIAFIIFKVQWSKEKKKARVGTIGKIELCMMCYMMLSALWSDTIMDSIAMAALWFGMFLIQVMIFNLARTKERIDTLLKSIVFGASMNGLLASLQIVSYMLYDREIIAKDWVLVTPFYKVLDKAVYSALPFKIMTNTFDDRASGFFSNPNLLATLLVISFPISIYLLINAKSKRNKVLYYAANILITCGISATMSRAGCVIALGGWILLFVLLVKKSVRDLISVGIPAFAVLIASILTRYGLIFQDNDTAVTTIVGAATTGEARKSSATHFEIWQSVIDYLGDHIDVFLFGNGFGCEGTSNVLHSVYDLSKPHAHNFILEFWMEIGLVGVIFILAIIIMAVRRMVEINADTTKKYSLMVCMTTSLLIFFGFGLTDYIFGSPKQIFMLMMLLGLIQAIYYTYNGAEMKNFDDLKQALQRAFKNGTRKSKRVHLK